MSKLRIYTVHVNPATQHSYESAQFVEEGFSFWAFVLGVLWALYHRLWWPALGLFVASVLIMIAGDHGVLSHSGVLILDFAVHFIAGAYGNEWRRNKLRHQGYITTDIVSGDSLVRSQQRFFDRYFATHSPAPFVG